MEDLAERIRNNDRSAERDFVDLFYGRVYAMAMARTRDREIALDLAQEIMLAVLAALRAGRLRDPAALPGASPVDFLYDKSDAIRRAGGQGLSLCLERDV